MSDAQILRYETSIPSSPARRDVFPQKAHVHFSAQTKAFFDELIFIFFQRGIFSGRRCPSGAQIWQPTYIYRKLKARSNPERTRWHQGTISTIAGFGACISSRTILVSPTDESYIQFDHDT
jgi:hypothetical protein